MNRQDGDITLRRNILDMLDVIQLTKSNINLLKNNEIMFIEDSKEGTTYLMDKDMNMYFVQLEYGKELTREDIYAVIPEYKEASYENQTVYTGINLGMGRALLIKTKIYKDYMKELKSNIVYNDQYRDCYNAYCSWMYCAIKFLKSR